MGTLESIIAQLVAQGYSPEEARKRAESAMLLGAAPPDVIFGAPPVTATDALPTTHPAGRPVPRSQAEYDQMMEAYNSGTGMLPMDGYETEGEVRQRYDSKFGRGAYGQYLMEKEARGEITIDPATGEPRRIGGHFAKPGRAAVPQNVADNLQASAAPIALEPVVGEPARQAVDPDDWEARYQQYLESKRVPEPTNSVERVDDYFDRKNNPEKYQVMSREQFFADLGQDMVMKRGQADLEKYGSGPNRTPEQQAAVAERAAIERRAANTGRADELRIARLAEQTGLTYAEAKEKYLTAKSNLSPNDGLAPDGLMTPEGIRLATEELRGIARDQRNAKQRELRERNQRRGMLAGSNVRANAANAIATMSDEDVGDVMRARMLPPGVAEAEARANIEGGRLGIQQQEAEARLAAIQSQIEAGTSDREQRAIEFRALLEKQEADRADRLEREAREWEERRAQREQEFKDRDASNARFMAELNARLQLGENERKARDEANAINRMEAEARIGALDSKVTQQQDALKRSEEMQKRQALVAQYGPGVEDILAGVDRTPAAEETLRKIALESDKNYFGFWKSDAERMNAILQRLGVEDPARRKQFVETYGLAPDQQAAIGPWGGTGRGARMSYWFSPRPTSY